MEDILLISIDYILGIVVYIIFLIYSGILIMITLKAIRRNIRNRLNQVFALFCLTMSLSSILLFFILFRDPSLSILATILANLMYYIGAILSAGLLLLCTLILLNYEKMANLVNIFFYIVIYIGITSGLWLIPNGVQVEVFQNTSPLTTFNLAFFLYFFLSLLFMFILTTYVSFKIYASFSEKILKKRFRFSIGGILLFFCYPMFTSVLVFFRLSFFIYTIIIIILVFLGISFIYYGLADTLEN